MTSISFKILKKFDGASIREFLGFYHLSKPSIYKLELNKAIKLNSVNAKLDHGLKVDDELDIDFMCISSNPVTPYDQEVQIIYEDVDLCIVHKEVGVLVHTDGITNDTLTNHLATVMKKQGHPYPVLPAHRIDTVTSGMVIFAKHPLALSYLSALFEQQHIFKKYTCICEGVVQNDQGIIDYPIGKHRHEPRQIVSDTGKTAHTTYRVISREIKTTHLEVSIKGGRKHQIRVHLSSLGHPIVGDTLYGARYFSRVMLHFGYVKFVHPRSLNLVEFQVFPNF